MWDEAGRTVGGLGGGGGPAREGTGKSGSLVERELVDVNDLRLRLCVTCVLRAFSCCVFDFAESIFFKLHFKEVLSNDRSSTL